MKLKTLISVVLSLCIVMSTAVSGAEYIYGDADGDNELTILDCNKVLKYILDNDSVEMSDVQLAVADIDKSGTINSADVATILQRIINSSEYEYYYADETEAETETETETTTEGNYYIELADSASKVYSYDVDTNTIGDEAESVDCISIDNTDNVVSLLSAGTYYMGGTLTDGQISVSDELTKSDSVAINLMGVDVTSSTTAPFNGGGSKITLYLADGTTNTFTDNSAAAYSGYVTSSAPKGALYSKRDLTIDESGTLVVNGNYSNGIVCGADISIKGGANVTVNAVKNGIKGDNSVSFGKKAGTISVTTQSGDGIKSDAIENAKFYTSDGSKLSAKADGIEDGKGYVEVKGGTITVSSGDDGIQADNYFNMTGGTLNITSVAKGIKANEALLYVVEEDDDDNYWLTYDTEGNAVTLSGTMSISGGTVNIDSGEDGLRACESLDISGGEINITASYDAAGDTSDGIQVGENTDTVTANTDGSYVTEREVTVKGTMTVSGGTVNILGATDDAIVSNGDFVMTAGTITGEADCDFFKVYDNMTISDGTFDIVSTCDGIQAGKALTVETAADGTETKSDYTEGSISISGGTFNITANEGTSNTAVTDDTESCKGIKSTKYVDISGGTFDINSADDGIHSDYNVDITGGTFSIATLDDGIHADYILTLGSSTGTEDDFTIDITYSYEGVEGSVIYMSSGTTYIYSTDDGVNAAGYYDTDGSYYDDSSTSSSNNGWNGNMWGGGNQTADDTAPYGMLYINGGYVYVMAPNGDGLDSNGSAEMSDGVVIVNGPNSSSSSNDVFDYGDDNGDYFKVTGGTLIGAGYNMSNTSLTVSGQGYASSSSSNGMGGMGGMGGMSGSSSASSGKAGNPVKVTTDSGNIVFIPQVDWGYMFVTTLDMSSNGSYTISSVSSYSGGTDVLGVTESGVYYGLVENVS